MVQLSELVEVGKQLMFGQVVSGSFAVPSGARV